MGKTTGKSTKEKTRPLQPFNLQPVRDVKLSDNIAVKDIVAQFRNTGFQGHNVFMASKLLKKMSKDRNCSIVISFPCNLVASGLRGVILDIVKAKSVSAIITTSGTVDEDFIRSKKPYLQGSFDADDRKLAKEQINRMGNIFVPNDRYELMEDLMPKILEHAFRKKQRWTSSELIAHIGTYCSPDSIIYWASRNSVPVFCPGIADGAFGMQLFLFQQKHPEFVVDAVRDLKNAVSFAFSKKRLGLIALGGGISKHHAILSALMRGGFDYAIYVNSSTPYHGSLSGATTSEAVSWGKVKSPSDAVTVHGDAQIIFPLLVASVPEMLKKK